MSDKYVAIRSFVPNLFTVKARQIEAWADQQLDARDHLPVLLRKLVHSTGANLRHVDFPGYDNAQRRGSDGVVEAGAATTWVPEGTSYWEFGTDQKPRDKAQKDYTARVGSVDPADRVDGTFVFVTPRAWPGKTAWEKQKNETGDWKTVRAFDASDLEQWLEQSVTAQLWLAEQINLPVSGYETLEQAWRRWAEASEPHLTPEIFTPSVTEHRSSFKKWLEQPSDRFFVITADSRDEALAYLACLFDDNELRGFADIAAVFTSPETLQTLVDSLVSFIPIVHSENVERKLAGTQCRLHCIACRPRNAVDKRADVALDLLGHEAFEKALMAMGITEGDIDRFARESARSPTILRRRLSKNAAIRTPAWAGDDATAKALVPMAMIGAWHAEREADRKIISGVANRQYEVIEDDVARLLRFDDSPVWCAGQHRGVASKIDALFAIATMVTQVDLDRFFVAAEHVLSESNPALELQERDQWIAAFYGKKRDHSDALREGVGETLVILSIHGNDLFHNRLGIDVEWRVATLIHGLLTPLTLEKLLSHKCDLPRYAEAAPDRFLSIIEEDLRQENPVVFGLLKPVDSRLFGTSPPRTWLLWALECLAWKSERLARVAIILAQLSRPRIDDNWVNKPDGSLHAIFRSWMPQTAASLEQRVKTLQILSERFPDVGWRVCAAQITPGRRIDHDNYRPNWRSDASGAGGVVTHQEMQDFDRKALDLLVAFPSHDKESLGELVELLEAIPEEDQNDVWDLIARWSVQAEETEKAVLREKIRRCALVQHSHDRSSDEAPPDRARAAYDNLQPRNPVIRHGWLFADHWVQESSDEISGQDFDYQRRDRQIDRLRRDAMSEIWNEHGFKGVEQLLVGSGAADTIGVYAATCVIKMDARVAFVRRCLSVNKGLGEEAEWCLKGFLLAIAGDPYPTDMLQTAAEGLPAELQRRLFVCAPFQGSTWRLMDDFGEDIRGGYWKNVVPVQVEHSPAERAEMIDRLLEARRPRAAFQAVGMDFESVETPQLKRLLVEIITVDSEPDDHFIPNRYYISKALDSLEGRIDVTRDDMAQLEFRYIEVLDRSSHGIQNLERQIAESPASFTCAVVRLYQRSDGGEDLPEWRIENPERRTAEALAAHSLLKQIKRIPGTSEDGRIDEAVLSKWLAEVRRQCREFARADVGDLCIGQLLANAPEGDNGMWPCEAVCKAMEEVTSSGISRGFLIGVLNSRGVHLRGKGGEQERALADKYRAWAERLHFDYPYTGQLLKKIAAWYDREARQNDNHANVAKRLRH